MRNLLIVGHGANNTGFARIATDIANSLCPYINVSHFSINTDQSKAYNKNVRYIHNDNIDDPYGITQIEKLILKLDTDIVLFIHDLWIMPLYLKRIKFHREKCKLIAYCPVDGLIVDETLIKDLDGLDGLVLYNTYASKQVKELFLKPLFVIPHCISSGFYKMESRADDLLNRDALKKQVFGNQLQENSSFIILNANRNWHRKRLDLTIRAFELFAKDKQDVYLCLLSNASVNSLSKYLGQNIKAKLICPFGSNSEHRLSVEQLNLLYNSCDIGVNTSMGEGWGLISFEHAITGAVQIIPDHSSGSELWETYGLLLKSQVLPSVNPVNLSIIEINDLVAYLDQLYSDRKFLYEQSQKCLDRALLLKEETSSYHSLWLNVFNNV